VYSEASSALAAVNLTASASNFLSRRLEIKAPPDLERRCKMGYNGRCENWQGCGRGGWRDWSNIPATDVSFAKVEPVYWWACGSRCQGGSYVLESCECACECPFGATCEPWSDATPAPIARTPAPTAYRGPYQESSVEVFNGEDDGNSQGSGSEQQAATGFKFSTPSEDLLLLLMVLLFVLCGLFGLSLLIPLLCPKMTRVFPMDDDEEDPTHLFSRSPEPKAIAARKSASEDISDAATDGASSGGRRSSQVSHASSTVSSQVSTPRSGFSSIDSRVPSARGQARLLPPTSLNDGRLTPYGPYSGRRWSDGAIQRTHYSDLRAEYVTPPNSSRRPVRHSLAPPEEERRTRSHSPRPRGHGTGPIGEKRTRSHSPRPGHAT
jgi:hypothetical protein